MLQKGDPLEDFITKFLTGIPCKEMLAVFGGVGVGVGFFLGEGVAVID